jgi:hypothetical protein
MPLERVEGAMAQTYTGDAQAYQTPNGTPWPFAPIGLGMIREGNPA